mmetsp:Transcript_19634/g.24766  ORF Transcript_19634/g.24766 Transcript_19634/m.24766 type:complete len:403 (-) Transcript_19634:191-1399(-)|eukprot:CAMPEP_0203677750 /NCGR_PEP_ID=MMETSP0090-20130426/29424_1 /ASSEMBLY_ACC=CAM_ASM_001088 /TAXON_ID=426623 /ORGANISM="Chaetoceros affinis, Strain CCMP159" /LENGTH=402 /DNA_ID=CAMNT_0050544741 /DNA_START=106 /DNA_END=1314 /DNA_ORIENTATION=-
MVSLSTLPYQYSVQITSASVSFIASMTIIIMVKRAKLITPYRRLIFGLSAGEAIHSLGMITGPLAPPVDLPLSPWGQGNTKTCEANGFLNVFGSMNVQLYLTALCVYLYYKLNRKMNDEVFASRVERKMHLVLNACSIMLSIGALATKSMNPIPTGAICTSARYPPGCGMIPEIVGECTRGLIALYFVMFSYFVTFASLITATVLMTLVIQNAYYIEKIHSLNPNRDHRSLMGCCSCLFGCHNEQDQQVGESHSDYVLRLYRRETIVQGLLYIGSFFLSHVMTVVITVLNMMGVGIPTVIAFLVSFLYPLMGFFNILVYCRPKVKMFRMTHPYYSWLQSFLLVVKAGGEVPNSDEDPHALRVCCCCHPRPRGWSDEQNSAGRYERGSSFLETLLIRAGLIGI